jgi:hypothetical protein
MPSDDQICAPSTYTRTNAPLPTEVIIAVLPSRFSCLSPAVILSGNTDEGETRGLPGLACRLKEEKEMHVAGIFTDRKNLN